jgi:hypothetical protein
MHEDRIRTRPAGRTVRADAIQGTPGPLLSPLEIGNQIPWKLDHNGEALWLTVTAVLGPGSYAVRYPDGSTGTLTDSE